VGPLAAAPLAAVVLAGCGGDRPHLARADAAPLIALSKRIAHEDRCGQARDIPKLQARTIALVNARRVPATLQETLLSGVNQLASQAPVCLPRAVRATPPPAQAAPAPPRGKPKHHAKKHGHGGDE
jgi:hypothetical protein